MPSGLTVDSVRPVMMGDVMRLLLALAFLGLFSNRAFAHLGHGSEIQVRLDDDKVRMVLRMATVNAWKFMGDEAPDTFDDDGRAAAVPLLKVLAPELIRMRSGGRELKPREVDAVFEVDEHVAFIYVYAAPVVWPLEVGAEFLRSLGDMETARVTAYHHSGEIPDGGVEPFLKKNLHRGNFRVAISLPEARTIVDRSPPARVASASAEHASGWGVAIGAGMGIVGVVAWFGLRRYST